MRERVESTNGCDYAWPRGCNLCPGKKSVCSSIDMLACGLGEVLLLLLAFNSLFEVMGLRGGGWRGTGLKYLFGYFVAIYWAIGETVTIPSVL